MSDGTITRPGQGHGVLAPRQVSANTTPGDEYLMADYTMMAKRVAIDVGG